VTVPRPALATILALGLVAAPLAAVAQQPAKVYRIGFLSSARASLGLEGLRQGFRDLGYVEGVHFTLETRYADLKLERLADLAEELVRLHVDVIVTASTPAAQAAQRATRTIPIVMTTGGDPVGSGLVASLARPGANVTGLTHLAGPEMQQKLLELLKEIAPPVSRIAVVTNSTIPPEERSLEAMQGPARRLGLTLVATEVRSPDSFAGALEAALRDRANALIAFESPLNTAHRQQIIDFAARHRLPTRSGSVRSSRRAVSSPTVRT
jgi:ABC-type uncharacterized transport system substrate-binding protein